MNKYIFAFLLTLLSINLFSQVDLNKLKQLQDEKNYYEAINGYKQILKQDPYNKEALQNIINIYININDYNSALEYVSSLIQLDTTSLSSLNILADIYKKLCEYNNAINTYEKIIKLSKYDIVDKNIIDNALKQKAILEKFVYELNNPSIQVNEFKEANSSKSEYGIYLYKDYLFVSKMISDRVNYRTTQGYDNIYYVNLRTWNSDTTNLKKLDALNKPLATQGYISIDDAQELIYFTRCEGTPSKCHINYSNYRGDPTNPYKPKKMIVKSDEFNEGHTTISRNGRTMIYTADYPEGFGKRDLYMITKTGNKWSKPINLGQNVNTEYDEMFPYLYQDTILFFSSDAHNSIGGLDLFMSVFTNNEWSKPKQLKFPINSGADDFNIQFFNKLNEGLFCSNRPGGSGFDDIYYFKGIPWDFTYHGKVISFNDKKPISNAMLVLYSSNNIDTIFTDKYGSFSIDLDPNQHYNITISKSGFENIIEIFNPTLFKYTTPISLYYTYELKPAKRIAVVEGKIIDDEKQMPSADHKVSLVSTKGYVDETKTNEQGYFKFENVPINNKYTLVTSKDGYLTKSQEIEINNKKIDIDLPVEQVNKETEYLIENIYYDFDKATLKEESKKELDKLAQLLKLNPNLIVQINSYCDERGNEEYNLKLSQARAQAVVDYLISKGISSSRLIAKGWGKANPVIPNASNEEEHLLNRRTTFNIVRYEKLAHDNVISNISSDIIEGISGTGNIIYTIQVAALSKPANNLEIWSSIYRLQPNIKIFEIKGNDGLYRYYVGEFNNAQDAIEFRNKLVSIGYTDCFVKIIEK
jgi:outer membrane protein OmpA-like peptidoglycan-associated protein